MTVQQYFARHFPAPWWRYPRSGYKFFDTSTHHLRNDAVTRLTDGIRRAAGLFWWSFFWSCVWAGWAFFVAGYFALPFWPALAIFMLGSFSGRCDKDQRRALLELRGRESDLAMEREFRRQQGRS